MVGFPKELKTKQDWLNAIEYAKLTGDGKAALKNRLLELKENTTVLCLKETSKNKPSDQQTPDDYEKVENPACEKLRLGFTDVEIDKLIRSLK
jgi:hypothetical protein